jgi:1-propanol dehydrogenase
LVDSEMLPDIAILDPAFVASVPPAITADTGMDVLCHALEAYVSIHASDFSDALAEKAVQQVFSYLPSCWRNGEDTFAREKMHNASCMAGMAFTNASLGITHSLAHALGGVFGIPHGRANALLMGHIVAWNADYAGSCDNVAAQKYAHLARLLGLPADNARQGVRSLLLAIRAMQEEMTLPLGIEALAVDAEQFEQQLSALAHQALRDSCTPTNPRKPDLAALIALLRQAWSIDANVLRAQEH